MTVMNILYEDSQLIIVNKPAGLSVLPDGWEKDSDYLVKMLEEYGNPSTGSGQAVREHAAWALGRLAARTGAPDA